MFGVAVKFPEAVTNKPRLMVHLSSTVNAALRDTLRPCLERKSGAGGSALPEWEHGTMQNNHRSGPNLKAQIFRAKWIWGNLNHARRQ